MPRPTRPGRPLIAGMVLLAACLPRATFGQDAPTPAPPPAPVQGANEAASPTTPKEALTIPDDPPPHEGAMIDIPLVIEPPDIIVVEVLEALPGRPITGERLVRLDGTISLGFYGDIHVRGLTTAQAKAKIILHLRRFFTDDMLGLKIVVTQPVEPLPKPGTKTPIQIEVEPAETPDAQPRQEVPAPAGIPFVNPPPTTGRSSLNGGTGRPTAARRTRRNDHGVVRTPRLVTVMQDPVPAPDTMDAAKPEENFALEAMYIDPTESSRVFVDIVSFNSAIYYVQGDVGSPGRLPITGKETVLDAMNYAGGLIPTAEPLDIHLYRPASGSKPAKDYPIDLAAIHKGDARANLQIFPNDRVFVGRNAIVRKTIEIDRASAPLNSVFSTALQQSFTLRAIGGATGVMNGSDDATRNLMLRKWFDFLWNLPPSNPRDSAPDNLLDNLRRQLEPPTEFKTTTAPK